MLVHSPARPVSTGRFFRPSRPTRLKTAMAATPVAAAEVRGCVTGVRNCIGTTAEVA